MREKKPNNTTTSYITVVTVLSEALGCTARPGVVENPITDSACLRFLLDHEMRKTLTCDKLLKPKRQGGLRRLRYHDNVSVVKNKIATEIKCLVVTTQAQHVVSGLPSAHWLSKRGAIFE